jgi:hypothetical protein
MIVEIRNTALTAAQIPPVHSDYPAIAAFALTFDGYARFDNIAGFANNHLSSYRRERQRIRQSTLTELRACLFYEQRRHRHMGEEPVADDRDYINALLTEIKRRVTENRLD